jgi:hypothetical protein
MENLIPILVIAAAGLFVAYKFGWLDKFLKKDEPAPAPVPVPVPPKTESDKPQS